MQRKLFHFGVIYWSIFCLVVVTASYRQGRAILDKCVRVKGEVMDEVWTHDPVQRKEVLRPQIRYPVDDSAYFYVDHNNSLAVGERPDVLYYPSNPEAPQVYNYSFWIDTDLLVPPFLGCLLVFLVIRTLASPSSSFTESTDETS